MLLLSDRHRPAAADVVGVDAGHAVEDAFQELGFRHFQAEHAHGGSPEADVGEDVDQGGGFPDSGPGGKHDHGAGLQAVQGQVQAAVSGGDSFDGAGVVHAPLQVFNDGSHGSADGFGLADAAPVPQGGHAALGFIKGFFRAFELITGGFRHPGGKREQRMFFGSFRDHFQGGGGFVPGKGSVGGRFHDSGVPSHGVKLALGFKAGDDGEGVHGSSRAGDGFQGGPDLLVRREAECLAADALVPEVRKGLGAVHCLGEHQFFGVDECLRVDHVF